MKLILFEKTPYPALGRKTHGWGMIEFGFDYSKTGYRKKKYAYIKKRLKS